MSGCKTVVSSSEKKIDPLRGQQIARLEEFSVLKEKQSQTLAAAAGEKISPEFQHFFDAATKGDWQTVTNMFESFKQRHPQYSHPRQHSDISLRTSYWGPVLEICLAYDNVVRCEPEYTQIAVDGIINSIPPGSIYFGGTDPGRGLPTAFSKSQPDADPFYTLTQNALADATYLEYLRRTYGEQRELLTQLADACRADKQLQALNAEWPAAVQKLESLENNPDDPRWKVADEAVSSLWQKRDERVKTILADVQARTNISTNGRENTDLYIPTSQDLQTCFRDYVADATQRLHNHQLKPGEDVKEEQGRIQVSGQVAVMEINGLLVKIIFDKNPGHEYFIEESFPLDWMYPYLEPHGLIFKINRQPLPELPDVIVQQDHAYWQKLVPGMIGNWLNEDTPVKDVIAFTEKVFLQHDLDGFAGDPRFVQNDYASKMFSKWRSSIAGLYAWRAEHTTAVEEQERMADAADFAFRQALSLCPYSPEATDRYAEFLIKQHRQADARLVLDMAEQFKHKSASVFQMRLVLDAPSAETESMTNEFQNGSASTVRAAEVLNVEKAILLDQSAVFSAKFSKNRMGHQEIEITFTDAGRKQFADITREHIHERLAMVIDGKLLAAPVIQAEITEGKAEITGTFSEIEAKTLTAKINQAIVR